VPFFRLKANLSSFSIALSSFQLLTCNYGTVVVRTSYGLHGTLTKLSSEGSLGKRIFLPFITDRTAVSSVCESKRL
jgi:hypothetical protein